MSDISCLEDIESLSVRQLKEILARIFVDYKGCCEKWELMEKVTRLYHDHRDRHNIGDVLRAQNLLSYYELEINS